MKKTEQAFLKDMDSGIITDAYCDGKDAQAEFDATEKGKPPKNVPSDS